MEKTTASQAPVRGATFVPLPSGVPASHVSRDRIREQLGWGLLQKLDHDHGAANGRGAA